MIDGVRNREAAPEWTPDYVRTARRHAVEAVDSGPEHALVAAVRELSAEVRALRHQLAGGSPPGKDGAVGELADTVAFHLRSAGR